ncbi:hypothetical protein [Cellulomonas soli]
MTGSYVVRVVAIAAPVPAVPVNATATTRSAASYVVVDVRFTEPTESVTTVGEPNWLAINLLIEETRRLAHDFRALRPRLNPHPVRRLRRPISQSHPRLNPKSPFENHRRGSSYTL